MAIEILVRAQNNGGNALGGSYLKGFPVIAVNSPWNWGGAEGPPDFIQILVSDSDDIFDVEHLVAEWKRKTTYEIKKFDATNDFFEVYLFADPLESSTNPVVQVNTKMMSDFLINWGATSIINSVDGGVTFHITAFNAIKNAGLFTFYKEDIHCKYTELNYNPQTGIHTVELDYSLSNLNELNIQHTLELVNLEIISINTTTKKCVFTGERFKLISVLEAQVAQKFNSMIARVRYRFSDTLVDQALSQSGKITLTLADIESHLIDVSTEV